MPAFSPPYVIAHGGHWLVDGIFGLSIVLIAAFLVNIYLRDRRAQRAEGDQPPPP